MTELMLKLAAFLAMVIDHAAACRLDRVFFPAFSKVYVISRAIGRMAFPIYTFCLVEGFRHSHDLRRYGGRLLLLGVISQLPYAFTLNRGSESGVPKLKYSVYAVYRAGSAGFLP